MFYLHHSSTLHQFDDLKTKQLSRINKSGYYFDNLKENKDLDFPQQDFTTKNIFLEFPIICKSKKIKDSLFEYLINKGIDIKNYYYKNCSEEKIYNFSNFIAKNSKNISENILMLPVHKKISETDQSNIIEKINTFYSNIQDK